MNFLKLVLLVSIVLLPALVQAQPYIEMETQHRFAQSYIGLNIQSVPAAGSYLWKGATRKLPFLLSPRITLGGLHFWGKVDFNLNFPLARFGDFTLDEESELYFNPGGDLSARFYPYKVEYGKLRPFIGYSANEMQFGLKDEEAGRRRELFITSSAIGGLSYANSNWQINAEMMWVLNNRRQFYADRTTEYTLELPGAYFSLGLVKYFEGTIREEKDLITGRVYEREEKLRKKGKLNSLSISFAPSGAYFMKWPSFDDLERQSLPRHKASMVWEFGAGYLFHDWGIHMGVSYRDYTSEVESYGFEHLIRRRSVAVEARKFFWDYNGFVPFVGPSISFERWATGEFEQNVQRGTTQRTTMISPGIVFGWDIIASPLETWILRTNLRYYPFQKIKGTDGQSIRTDQFEFNFIQLVIYPNRVFNFLVPKEKK